MPIVKVDNLKEEVKAVRISGLSSGLDVEQIIEDLMRVERIPVDRVFQQKVQAEWKRDAYRDVNMKFLRLRNMSFDLGLQGTFEKKTATSSHENILTVTATGQAQEGQYELQVNRLATAGRVVFAEAGGRLAEYFEDGVEEASFTLRGEDGEWHEITVSQEDDLLSIANRINENKNLGIHAFSDGESISLTTRATGAEARIEVQEPDGFFAEVFGQMAPEEGVGQNAVVNVNGIEIEAAENTINLNGLIVDLHAVDQETTVRVSVDHDVDAAVDSIKEFVDLYNELVDELNAALREETFRDFKPLTDEEKAQMSDKEIELWEEKARSGILRSDQLVSNVLTEMRLALGGVVEGLGDQSSLAQIGIKTGAWFEYGRLYVDEEKLRGAIRDNPTEVRDLFTQNGEGNTQGIAKRLTEALDRGMKRIDETAGKSTTLYDQSFLGERIRDYEDRLMAMEERLISIEQNHWRKFTAMEQVLSQLYAQSDWLYQQMLTMQG